MSYREHEEVDSKSFASYRSQPITGQTALAEPRMFPACSADSQVKANMAERSVAIHSRHSIGPSPRNYDNALGTVVSQRRKTGLRVRAWQGDEDRSALSGKTEPRTTFSHSSRGQNLRSSYQQADFFQGLSLCVTQLFPMYALREHHQGPARWLSR